MFHLKRCIFHPHRGEWDHSMFVHLNVCAVWTSGAVTNPHDRGHFYHTFCSSGVKRSLVLSLYL